MSSRSQALTVKIALPYAEALLESAQEKQAVEQTNKDLNFIAGLLSKSSELQTFLDNPLITTITKKSVLKDLLVNQVNNFVVNFLLILVDRRRITLLSIIIEKYLELSYKVDSITIAEVRAAIALTEIQQVDLIQKLKNLTNSKEVKLVMKIDPELIGGLIIKVGSKVIDTSLAGKLKQMSSYLNGNTN